MAARRGKFGNYPRAQPSLTNTIVAIAQAMQAAEDRNITDAWQNGGEFQGKQVTDQMLLAYWHDREKNLSHDDPLYDDIHSRVMQLDYGIAQSKMELLYKQGKINETQFAKFYSGWAKKVPKNSEFWRVLQKQAATFLQAAKEKGRRSADAAKVKSFNEFVDRTQKNETEIGNQLQAAMYQMAKDLGYNLQTQGAEVAAALTDDLKAHPDKWRLLTDAIKVGDPTFDGIITPTYYSSKLAEADRGYGKIADRAKKDGYAGAYESAAKAQQQIATAAIDANTWSVSEAYQVARDKLDAIWSDETSTQADKQQAAQDFADVLDGLSKSPGIGSDIVAVLENDAEAWRGGKPLEGPSFGEMMTGQSAGGEKKGSDNGFASQVMSIYAATTAAQQADPTGWVNAPLTLDSQGQPTYDPSGKGGVGLVPSASIPASTGAVTIPTLTGGLITAFLPLHDVRVMNPDESGGQGQVIGRTSTYQVGGKTVTIYGYVDSSGRQRWSFRSPWADNVAVTVDKNGDTILTPPPVNINASVAAVNQWLKANGYGSVDVSALVGKNPDGTPILNPDGTPKFAGGVVSGVSDTVYKRDGAGKLLSKGVIKFSDGKFTFDETGYTSQDFTKTNPETGKETTSTQTVEGTTTTISLGTTGTPYTPDSLKTVVLDPARDLTVVPNIDFNTLIEATTAANEYHVSPSTLQDITNDQVFQATFMDQAITAAGVKGTSFEAAAAQASWQSFITDVGKHITYPVQGNGDIPTAQQRVDLQFPGVAAEKAKGGLDITFGQKTPLKLPNVPTYVNARPADILGGGPNRPVAVPPPPPPAPVPHQVEPTPTAAVTPVSPRTVQPVTVKPFSDYVGPSANSPTPISIPHQAVY